MARTAISVVAKSFPREGFVRPAIRQDHAWLPIEIERLEVWLRSTATRLRPENGGLPGNRTQVEVALTD